MKRSRKSIMVLVTLTVITCCVATGIHLLNKDAQANVTYTIQVFFRWDELDDWDYMTNQPVTFTFNQIDFEETTNETAGAATHIEADWYNGNWTASYDDDDWEVQGANPAVIGGANNYHAFYVMPGD